MKQKRVLRYYCDYCKKSSGAAWAMKKHERGCTMNPNRTCGMCNLMQEHQEPMTELLQLLPDPAVCKQCDELINMVCMNKHRKIFGEDSYIQKVLPAAIKKLRAATNNCPACILAAIRQRSIPVHMAHDFNYSEECKQFWSDFNESELRHDEWSTY